MYLYDPHCYTLPNHIVAFVQQEMDDGVVKKGTVKCSKNMSVLP